MFVDFISLLQDFATKKMQMSKRPFTLHVASRDLLPESPSNPCHHRVSQSAHVLEK